MTFLKSQLFFITLCICFNYNSAQRTFTNPILDHDSPDPAIIRHGAFYYLVGSSGDGLRLFKSSELFNFRNAEVREVWHAPPGYGGVWAPEAHFIWGNLYIYFCMDDGNDDNRRNWVVRADNPDDPMGSWSDLTILAPDFNFWSIDGTVLQHGNGQLYFVWVSPAMTGKLSLWIADMPTPTIVGSTKILLREPSRPWECNGGCVSEGPFFIHNRAKGETFLIFSGSSTWDPNYCLGLMSIRSDWDPLILTNWFYGWDGPVFWRNDEEGVYTTGHAAFTVSPDGTETWMSYHGTNVDYDIVNQARIARIEKIGFDNDGGFPIFPRPHGYSHPQPVPSGS